MIPYLFIAVGWIWGIHCLFDEGYALHFIAEKLEWLPDWITKPLWGCPPCMSSFHGTLIFALFIHSNILEWIVFCVTLCGLNFIIKNVAIQD